MIRHRSNGKKSEPVTLGYLSSKTEALLQGDPDIKISGVGTITNAKLGDISFIANAAYRSHLGGTTASAVILNADDAKECPVAALVCADPKLVFAQVLQLLYPYQTVMPTMHPTAIIGEDSEINAQSYIGAHCVIGKRVKIAANVIVEAGCIIGDDCSIGEGTVLYPRVTLYHGCTIGKDSTLHSGVVIGSDGFGYAKNKDKWFKVAQIAGVVIGDRVEIGANTTIDRGAIEDTEINNDVILDNLIQIGHNVKIGEGTAIAACTGIAGSTQIGKHCMIGGGSAINGHISITNHVHLVGCSNVAQSITQSGAYASAVLLTDIKTWKKNQVRIRQLDDFALRLKACEKKLKAQEEKQECP